MARPSHLIYTDSRTDLHSSQSTDGDVFYRSQEGVPVVWFFAFGGRNIWNPGDDVEARGGAVGARNPYETQIEVALVRLEQAESALESDPYLWPFLGAVAMFRRKLLSRPKQAFLRVAAPWVIGLESAQIDRWRAATAFAENAVNMVSAGRHTEGMRALAELKPFCPFVPDGHFGDIELLEKTPAFAREELPVKLALLTLGIPDARENFEKAARKELTPLLDGYKSLPPRPKPAPGSSTASGTSAEKGPGLLGRLGGLFGKKKGS